MITWTSRLIALLCALTLLAACEEGQGGSPFAASTTPRNTALSQAKMAQGAVTVVPPEGFCIDKSTLKARFALMARCDRLGAPQATGSAAPVGIITVSLAPATADRTLPQPIDSAKALGLEQIADQVTAQTHVTFRAQGGPPVDGMSDRHWRGTALVGSYLMSLALFGPAEGRAVGAEGRGLLLEVIAATRAAD